MHNHESSSFCVAATSYLRCNCHTNRDYCPVGNFVTYWCLWSNDDSRAIAKRGFKASRAIRMLESTEYPPNSTKSAKFASFRQSVRRGENKRIRLGLHFAGFECLPANG